MDSCENIYVVVREWEYDLDRKAPASWFSIFMSRNYQKASDFLLKHSNEECGKEFHLCDVPTDVEIDFIEWEKYVIDSAFIPDPRYSSKEYLRVYGRGLCDKYKLTKN